MKLCSIVPVKYASLMYERPIVMLLAHLSKTNDEYVAQAVVHDDVYKIMDNSIIELGESFTMDDLVTQAEKCLVDEIVLPDVFNDGPATLVKVQESIEWLRKHDRIGNFKLMAVCHGKNIGEFLQSYKALSMIKEVDVIGIPKIVCSWCGTRDKLLPDLEILGIKKNIHLLGCYDSLGEIAAFNEHERKLVRSIDTCLPALLSLKTDNAYVSRDGCTLDLQKATIDIYNYMHIIRMIEEDFNM